MDCAYNPYLSGVPDVVQDVASASVPLEPDHGRALPDPAHGIAQVLDDDGTFQL